MVAGGKSDPSKEGEVGPFVLCDIMSKSKLAAVKCVQVWVHE